jgi:hypothetical protein
MTESIVRHETSNGAALAPSEWTAMREQAKALVMSGFLPKAINTPEKAIALALAGRELGLPMMQAIRSIHIIEGKPVMSADLMAALVHRRIPGALLRIAETSNTKCVVEAGRAGQKSTLFTFTIEDAKAAGLLGKDNWRKYPRAMLRARCLAEAVRAAFPDSMLAGVYHPDELGAVTNESGEIIEEPAPQLPQVTPHDPLDYNENGSNPPRLLEMIKGVETLMAGGDLVGARRLLGSKAVPRSPGSATLAIQLEKEAGNVSANYAKELGKNWMRVERKLSQLEAKHSESRATDVVASFIDEDDGTVPEELEPGSLG